MGTMDTPTDGQPSPATGYEFTTGQDLIIRTTGSRARTWGILTLIGAGLTALTGVLALLTGEDFGLIAAIIYAVLSLIPLFVGLNFLRAGKSLDAVVTTSGSDIDHLMESLGSLGKALFIQIVAMMIWLAMVVLGIVLSIAIPDLGN
jgi:ribose/xylose/arabinose/galactoside ABC-type transport system permease subunit